MRIKPEEHSRHAWRIEQFARDFELVDAWSMPVEGRVDEFPRFVEMMASLDPAGDDGSRSSRMLFRLRLALGRLFGWDESPEPLPIPGSTETSLRDRLEPHERPDGDNQTSGGTFQPVYCDDREYAGEISNSTVHAVMHLGWVAIAPDRCRAQMGVYVKTRGRFGRLYMGAIAPFRHWIVYPALMRRVGQMWRSR